MRLGILKLEFAYNAFWTRKEIVDPSTTIVASPVTYFLTKTFLDFQLQSVKEVSNSHTKSGAEETSIDDLV